MFICTTFTPFSKEIEPWVKCEFFNLGYFQKTFIEPFLWAHTFKKFSVWFRFLLLYMWYFWMRKDICLIYVKLNKQVIYRELIWPDLYIINNLFWKIASIWFWKFLLSKGCWLSKKGHKTHWKSLIIYFWRRWARRGKIFKNELSLLHWWKGIWQCNLFPSCNLWKTKLGFKLLKAGYIKSSYSKVPHKSSQASISFPQLSVWHLTYWGNCDHWIEMCFFVTLDLSFHLSTLGL